MANIFEINKAILDCMDLETGEIFDEEALDALQMERTEKIENVGQWIKELQYTAKAIAEEEKALKERRASMEGKADNLIDYLTRVIGEGNSFDTAKIKIGWRKSTAVEVDDMDALPQEYVRETVKFDPDKIALKDALKNGEIIPGARLVERHKLYVK